jgi:hypothetical protein
MSDQNIIYFRDPHLIVFMFLGFMFSGMAFLFALALLAFGHFIFGLILFIISILVLFGCKTGAKSLEKGMYLHLSEKTFYIDYRLFGMSFKEKHPENQFNYVRVHSRYADKNQRESHYFVELKLKNGKIFESAKVEKEPEPIESLLEQIKSAGIEVKD